mmetsp:Transcript_62759/g.147165  ORF Transcript_62759/g.147165 Transcript_62759/m.147165 type:complete len:148 (+) Transcript_62759:186-629(+)
MSEMWHQNTLFGIDMLFSADAFFHPPCHFWWDPAAKPMGKGLQQRGADTCHTISRDAIWSVVLESSTGHMHPVVPANFNFGSPVPAEDADAPAPAVFGRPDRGLLSLIAQVTSCTHGSSKKPSRKRFHGFTARVALCCHHPTSLWLS